MELLPDGCIIIHKNGRQSQSLISKTIHYFTTCLIDTHTYLVDTDSFGDGDAVLKPDAVHYNAVGQVLLGTSFAEALIDRP